jgi:hypothetical protein
MADQSRDIYRVAGIQDRGLESQLNMILSRLADRLDRMEGLRGNPRFYKSLFDIIGQNLSAGQVLKVISGEQAEIGTLDVAEVENAAPAISSGTSAQINIERSLISLIDAETDTVVHQFPTQWLEYNCEVFMFTTNESFEMLAWTSNGDVSGPDVSVSSNIAEFDGTTGKIIKDGALSHSDVAAAVAYSLLTTIEGAMLVQIRDFNDEIIHEVPLEWFGLSGEVFAIE